MYYFCNFSVSLKLVQNKKLFKKLKIHLYPDPLSPTTTTTKSSTSLVAQWLRVCLPMQGTRVRALVWEDPTCCGAIRPVSHNYWACASGACAPQQERPWQWEARAPWWRVAPARRNWRKPSHRNKNPTQPKNKLKKKKKVNALGCLHYITEDVKSQDSMLLEGQR